MRDVVAEHYAEYGGALAPTAAEKAERRKFRLESVWNLSLGRDSKKGKQHLKEVRSWYRTITSKEYAASNAPFEKDPTEMYPNLPTIYHRIITKRMDLATIKVKMSNHVRSSMGR